MVSGCNRIDVVPQQTPLAVTADPPLLVMFPPEVAEVLVIADAAVVAASVGTVRVVKVTSVP